MKKVALFALFALAGVSALNAQAPNANAENQKMGNNSATQTLEYCLWLSRGND